jgi:hypothetical protein
MHVINKHNSNFSRNYLPHKIKNHNKRGTFGDQIGSINHHVKYDHVR